MPSAVVCSKFLIPTPPPILQNGLLKTTAYHKLHVLFFVLIRAWLRLTTSSICIKQQFPGPLNALPSLCFVFLILCMHITC